MIVNCNNEVEIILNDEENEAIKKAYEILKEIRHKCFMQGSNSDTYWMSVSATSGIYNLMRFNGVNLEEIIKNG